MIYTFAVSRRHDMFKAAKPNRLDQAAHLTTNFTMIKTKPVQDMIIEPEAWWLMLSKLQCATVAVTAITGP